VQLYFGSIGKYNAGKLFLYLWPFILVCRLSCPDTKLKLYLEVKTSASSWVALGKSPVCTLRIIVSWTNVVTNRCTGNSRWST